MNTERVVLGRYRILEQIGRGAMGVIYRGMDPVLDREVAIKAMSADFTGEGGIDAKKRFFREARAAAKLQHRNIVTVFEFAEGDDGIPYIVMEFLRGKNLASRLHESPPLSLEQKLRIVSELCDGLQFAADNGIIHRDVKPANVWLLDDGSVKLVDFGIAKIITATSTLGKEIIGSAAYMSPEQAEGHVVDARTDIFSAGIVLYELIAGRRPFEASTPTATLLKIVQEAPPPLTNFAPDTPPALVAVVDRALQKNAANRFQMASELGAAVRIIRSAVTAGLESSLSIDPLLGSTSTTHTAVPPSQVSTATTTAAPTRGTSSRATRLTRLILAGLVGGLVVTGLLYWLNLTPGREPGSSTTLATSATPTPAPTNTALPPTPPKVLRLVTDPAGAAVSVDGVPHQQATPTTISTANGTPRRVRFTRWGFQNLEVDITPEHLAAGQAQFKLIVEQILYTFRAPYSFEVRTELGQPFRATAPSHQFLVSRGQRFRLVASAVFLDVPFEVPATGALYPLPGTVQVRFMPGPGRDNREGCTVSLAGRQIATVGDRPTVPIVVGKHEFSFACPQTGEKFSRQLTLEPGSLVVNIQ